MNCIPSSLRFYLCEARPSLVEMMCLKFSEDGELHMSIKVFCPAGLRSLGSVRGVPWLAVGLRSSCHTTQGVLVTKPGGRFSTWENGWKISISFEKKTRKGGNSCRRRLASSLLGSKVLVDTAFLTVEPEGREEEVQRLWSRRTPGASRLEIRGFCLSAC